MVWLPRNEKQTTYRLNSRPQMWPSGLTLAMTLNLNFQGQMWNFLYLSQKWSVCHETKKQTYRLNSRPQMWPMCLTLTITLTFEFWRSNMTFTFDRTHDLDHGFSWSNFEIAVSQNGRADWHCTKGVAVGHSWPWPWPFGDQGQVYMDLPDSDGGDFSCRHAVDSSSYIHRFLWHVITHPCPNFSNSLMPLEFGHGWSITSHCFTWM